MIVLSSLARTLLLQPVPVSKPLRRSFIMSSVDSEIIKSLSLDPDQTSITSHGGSGFASTSKISSTVDGQPVKYFVKTGTGKDSEVMFRGECHRFNGSIVRVNYSQVSMRLSTPSTTRFPISARDPMPMERLQNRVSTFS